MSEWSDVSLAPSSIVGLLWTGFILCVGFAAASGWSRVVAGSLASSRQVLAVELLDRRFAEGEIDPQTHPAQRAALVRTVVAYRERERVLDRDGSPT